MKRRTLLRELGAVGAAVSLAGCIADREGLQSDESGDGENDDAGGNESDGSDGDGTSDDGTADDGTADDEPDSVPSIESSSITTGERQCGSRNDATVAFEDAAVAIDGTVAAPDPCREAAIETAEYDAEADELRVAVGTAEAGDDICADCIAEVAYEARVEFADGLPGRSVVRHEGPGGDSEIVADEQR